MSQFTAGTAVQALLSSPAPIGGELSGPDFRIRICFPPRGQRVTTPPRQYYILFVTPPTDADHTFGTFLANRGTRVDWFDLADTLGIRLLSLAAVWYGKRLDYHGVIADRDLIYFIPDLTSANPLRDPSLVLNNPEQRSDFAVPLGWENLPIGLLFCDAPVSKRDAFWTAAYAYLTALQVYEIDPQLAYIRCVVALEKLANELDLPPRTLYDEQTWRDLEEVRQVLGDAFADRWKSRLYQQRRRVVHLAQAFTNHTFFEGRPGPEGWAWTLDQIEVRIKGMYDLRSLYVHEGWQFGDWLTIGNATMEVQPGQPIIPGAKERAKTLGKAPTLAGLERLTRFILLTFAHHFLQPLDERLAIPQLAVTEEATPPSDPAAPNATAADLMPAEQIMQGEER